MSKKWSQFDPFSALTGVEEIVGLQSGANKRGALNGVFKTYFDTLYLPLGGTADLTSSVTIDGNGFNLILGSVNPFNTFEVHSSSTTGLYTDDGIDASYLEVVSNQLSLFGKNIIRLDVDDGAGGTGVFQMHNTTGFLFESSIQLGFGANDGISNSSFILEPDHYHIALEDAHIHSDGNSISLEMDDGVNASTFSLTPIGAAFNCPVGVGSYTVATLPSATGAARIIYVSDESGGPILAFSDNTNWRRVTDGSIVS